MARLFVAVWPPASLVEELGAVELGDGVRRVRPERLHVTLRFLGDADADTVIAAVDGVAMLSATATAGGRVGLLGRDAVVVPVSGLDELAGAVARATTELGVPPRERFVGHLTIGRARRRTRSDAVLTERSFAVESIDLVRSVLGASGPTYTTLHSWPTRGDVAT